MMACLEDEKLMADVKEDASRVKEEKEVKSKQLGLACWPLCVDSNPDVVVLPLLRQYLRPE